MKHIFLLLTSLLLLSFTKEEERNPAIMLIGDSWLQLPCVFNTYNKLLVEYGHKDKKVECLRTTQSGSRVNDWLKAPKVNMVRSLLIGSPSLKVVILSIGGNDLLNDWHKDMEQAKVSAIYERIERGTVEIIRYIQKARPDVKIVLTGYDYPNFSVLSPIILPYNKLYQDMGRPTHSELNQYLLNATVRIAKVVTDLEQVYYVSNLGLGQHLYGHPDYNVGPGELPMPGNGHDFSRLIGGDPEIPQNPQTLLKIKTFGIYDPYHLDPGGFKNIARNLMETYINDWLE